MKSKTSIVRENLHLPLHKMKKEIKKLYPETTNEDVEELVSKIYSLNPNTIKHVTTKQIKETDDYER